FLLVTLLYSLTFKSTFRLKSIEIICLLSIAYLAVSFLINIHPDNNLYIYLRQFMIFGYLIQSYFIFKAVAGFKNGTQVLIQVLTFFAVITVPLQIIYILYILFALEENPFLNRNHFSPIVVLGVITTTSLFLTYLNGYKKILIFILTLMISLSIGHDSAYLAVICIFLLSYFFNASFKIKILVSTLAIFGGIALYFFCSNLY